MLRSFCLKSPRTVTGPGFLLLTSRTVLFMPLFYSAEISNFTLQVVKQFTTPELHCTILCRQFELSDSTSQVIKQFGLTHCSLILCVNHLHCVSNHLHVVANHLHCNSIELCCSCLGFTVLNFQTLLCKVSNSSWLSNSIVQSIVDSLSSRTLRRMF